MLPSIAMFYMSIVTEILINNLRNFKTKTNRNAKSKLNPRPTVKAMRFYRKYNQSNRCGKITTVYCKNQSKHVGKNWANCIVNVVRTYSSHKPHIKV